MPIWNDVHAAMTAMRMPFFHKRDEFTRIEVKFNIFVTHGIDDTDDCYHRGCTSPLSSNVASGPRETLVSTHTLLVGVLVRYVNELRPSHDKQGRKTVATSSALMSLQHLLLFLRPSLQAWTPDQHVDFTDDRYTCSPGKMQIAGYPAHNMCLLQQDGFIREYNAASVAREQNDSVRSPRNSRVPICPVGKLVRYTPLSDECPGNSFLLADL